MTGEFRDVLNSDELLQKLADADADEIEPMLRATLKMADADTELASCRIDGRGDHRTVELTYRLRGAAATSVTLRLPPALV